MGIAKDSANTSDIIGISNLLEQYKIGKKSCHWLWYELVDPKYRDWNEERALLSMYDNTAVDYFVEECQKILKITETTIDLHCKNNL